MTTRLAPLQCGTCKHFLGGWYPEPSGRADGLADDGWLWRCAAYPDAIPDPIVTGEFDHRLPYEGDGGIRWEPGYEERAQEP